MTDQPTVPATAAEAGARITELQSNKEWSEKFLAGDSTAKTEFDALSQRVVQGDDPVAQAMSGALPEMSDADLHFAKNTANALREVGIPENAVKEALSGSQPTQAEFDAVKNWRDRAMRDEAFVKRYLTGDADARTQMTLAAIVLSGEIKGTAA
jgi:hypothetical protein